MMDAAIDLRQELSNLQRFQANFAEEHDVVIPTPYPRTVGEKVLTMAMISGYPFSTGPASRRRAGTSTPSFIGRPRSTWR